MPHRMWTNYRDLPYVGALSAKNDKDEGPVRLIIMTPCGSHLLEIRGTNSSKMVSPSTKGAVHGRRNWNDECGSFPERQVLVVRSSGTLGDWPRDRTR
jgi:hypothetical protein